MEYSKSFLYIMLLLIFYDFSENIVFPLTVRLLENAICEQKFAQTSPHHGTLHEWECKTAEIQSELAVVRGWYSLFRTVPAIATGPFFGGLADSWGRRPVYGIAVTGLLLQIAALYIVCFNWAHLPIQTTWATGIFSALGGGQFVIVGVNLTMVSDIAKPEERSQYLYAAFAIRFLADLITPQVAASALEHSLWLPTSLASLCLATSYPVLLLLKEPLQTKTAPENDSANETPSASAISPLKHLLTDWKILLCMAITFLLQFRYMNESIFISYASVRFGWSIAKVSRLLSITPGVSLCVSLALPVLHKALSKRFSEQRQSFLVAEALISALVIGDVLIVLAVSMPFLIFGLAVIAIGMSVRAPILALASSYIDSEQGTASLFTLLSVTDAFAHTVGDPLLQTVWRSALQLGDPWLILPFIATIVCFVLALTLSWALPLESATENAENDATRQPLLSR